jgi:putative tryptophan/tyrosine transport system substrate-binding protein
MHRRMFMEAMTAGLVAAPFAASAQTPATVRRIAILTTDTPRSSAEADRDFAPLRALGWVEGQNLLVERRCVSGRVELLRPSAEEIVRHNVEVIGTQGTPAALAAKNATKTIPIVLWSAGDPVARA